MINNQTTAAEPTPSSSPEPLTPAKIGPMNELFAAVWVGIILMCIGTPIAVVIYFIIAALTLPTPR